MTREQDFERHLSEWLGIGPLTAPTEVVDRAVEQTHDRPRRHRWSAWLLGLTDRLGYRANARWLSLPVVLVITLLAALAVAVPLAGGPGPAPEMDPSAASAITGSARITDESETPTDRTRVFDIDVGDPRIDGQARQELEALLDSEKGMYHWRGTMRLENAWGAWEGPVDIAGYPTGEEFELASLSGSGAYEGFIYLYTIRSQPSGTERTVEGAIWPVEPPPMPDPSLLP